MGRKREGTKGAEKKGGPQGPLKFSLSEEESKEKLAVHLTGKAVLCGPLERHNMLRCAIHGSDYNPCSLIDNSVNRNIIHAS